ncbi:hypothetical protein RR48_00738 [Papilio machaon]|uniref:Uncharacterized protein n=1 Tax=Papilio machaon TaxID=76193 RepID=A0A0N1IQM4_PAPMA|nr:hypothetical protein RR48_00738 [Papilio machaon]
MCDETIKISLFIESPVLFDSRPGRLVSGSAYNSGQAPHSVLNFKSNCVTVNSSNNVSSRNCFDNDTQTHLKEFRRLQKVSHQSSLCDETIRIRSGNCRSVQCDPKLNELGSGPADDSCYAPHSNPNLKSNFVMIKLNNKIILHNYFIDDIQTHLKRFSRHEMARYQSSTFSYNEKMCSRHCVIFTYRQSDVWCCVNVQLPQSTDVLDGSPRTANYYLKPI